MNKTIIRYRLKVLLKQLAASALSCVPSRRSNSCPDVTLFISSLNTRLPLELTIQTLTQNTRYPNYRLLVGENGSTDGSQEYLEDLKNRYPVEVMAMPQPRMHKDWLNEIYQTVKTPYWIAIDSDMLFLGRDWLMDMISVMESNTDLFLLSAEHLKASYGQIEPVGHEVIDLGERISTWLFCVRTSLRDHLKSDFAFTVNHVNPATKRKFCYDVGGQFLADMRVNNLHATNMPSWFKCKYHHFGSLSWAVNTEGESQYQTLKRYQLEDIKQRINTRV